MELALNLVWLFTALALLRLWIAQSPRSGRAFRLECAALVMLLVVLFPVISVSDDLQIVQSTAETEGSSRRDHVQAQLRFDSTHPAAVPVNEFSFAPAVSQLMRLTAVRTRCAPEAPCQLRLLNRPPPSHA